jgi:hypothetical protein
MNTPKYFIPGNSIGAIIAGRVGDVGTIVSEEGNTYLVKFPDTAEPERWTHDEGYTANTKEEAREVTRFYLAGE